MNLDFLKVWNGAIIINGTEYPSYEAVPSELTVGRSESTSSMTWKNFLLIIAKKVLTNILYYVIL